MPRISFMAVASIGFTFAVVMLTGCASTVGPRQLRTAVPPAAAGWSRVRALRLPTVVLVTVNDAAPRTGWLVQANAARLTVLDLAEETVPRAAARALLAMAAARPESFGAMGPDRVFQQDDVRVGRDGVFVRGRRVAEFDRVVASVARGDVVELRGPVVARGSVFGAIVGGWLGFSAGVVPGLGGASPGAAWSALIGSIAAGGFLGSHWSSHSTAGLVYRAASQPDASGRAGAEPRADVDTMTRPAATRVPR